MLCCIVLYYILYYKSNLTSKREVQTFLSGASIGNLQGLKPSPQNSGLNSSGLVGPAECVGLGVLWHGMYPKP